MKYVFYDVFDDSFITERDTIAPPERYILTLCYELENVNVYTETYEHNGQRLNIAYDATVREHVNEIRRYHSEKNNFPLDRMISWSVPKKHFDTIINTYELQPLEM